MERWSTIIITSLLLWLRIHTRIEIWNVYFLLENKSLILLLVLTKSKRSSNWLLTLAFKIKHHCCKVYIHSCSLSIFKNAFIYAWKKIVAWTYSHIKKKQQKQKRYRFYFFFQSLLMLLWNVHFKKIEI